jgi:hypothetical protein
MQSKDYLSDVYGSGHGVAAIVLIIRTLLPKQYIRCDAKSRLVSCLVTPTLDSLGAGVQCVAKFLILVYQEHLLKRGCGSLIK